MKRLFLLTLIMLFSTPAMAVTKEDQASIASAEEYLSKLTTIVADFVQVAPDGSLTSGKFFLSRPGKMRWQYDPPTPILMLANGTFLVFYDYELDQVSHVPLEDTLAGFLARDEIKFGGDVQITKVERGAGSLRLSMEQKAKPDAGKLTLEFATGPMQLRNMKVVDSTGQETSLSLSNARFGQKLDDKLFVFEDPRLMPRIGKDAFSDKIDR